MSIYKIATTVGVARNTISAWIKEFGWNRPKRITAIRTQYRNAASDMLGRRFKAYEQVHHIDGDVENNKFENLYVYSTAKEHAIGHKTLEKCAYELLRSGTIKFDRTTGFYGLT